MPMFNLYCILKSKSQKTGTQLYTCNYFSYICFIIQLSMEREADEGQERRLWTAQLDGMIKSPQLS